MFGKTSHVSALKLRKQLLIAESELNRAQLSDEWRKMTAEILDLADWAKTTALWSSSSALLMAGLAAFRKRSVVAAREKPSWFQRALEWVQLANSFWQAFRSSLKTTQTQSKHEPEPDYALGADTMP